MTATVSSHIRTSRPDLTGNDVRRSVEAFTTHRPKPSRKRASRSDHDPMWRFIPQQMTSQAAHRAAVTVGSATFLIGGALLTAPRVFGPLIGLSSPAGTRVVGALDLVLVPGLLMASPRWPWLAARAGLM